MSEIEGELESKTIWLIAFDPGETTGVAEFNSVGECLALHQLKINDLLDYLADMPYKPHIVVIEEYRIFAHKAASHSQSKVPTIQVVGMIKSYAHRWAAKCVEQPVQAKVLGYKLSNTKQAANHKNSHQLDAFVHGYYWLVKHKIVIPK